MSDAEATPAQDSKLQTPDSTDTTPRVVDTMASLTLSSSSEPGESNTRVPTMGEDLAQWVEELGLLKARTEYVGWTSRDARPSRRPRASPRRPRR